MSLTFLSALSASPSAVTPPYFSRIYPYLVRSGFNGCNCQPIIEVNIGHHRNIHLRFNLLQHFCRFHVGNGYPYDVAARIFQLAYLTDKRLPIVRVHIGH